LSLVNFKINITLMKPR